MKSQNERSRTRENGKYYIYTILGFAAILITTAIIIIAVALSARKANLANNQDNEISASDTTGDIASGDDDINTDVETEGFCSPVDNMDTINDYGFYFNKTVNSYYMHEGMDISAEAGAKVYAVDDGTVVGVFASDLLVGSQIVIDHGNGVKTVYDYVEAKDGVKVGDKVKRGDVIGNVMTATGNEYKDGAHLHFEVLEKDVAVDPAKYLTLAEK